MKQDLPPHIKAMRKFFLPKTKEVTEQCVSCPFRAGNDEEWRAILSKLRAAKGLPGEITKGHAARTRNEVHEDCANQGEFRCHHSVYNPDMTMKPVSEHRQCKGATLWFRGEEVG